LIGKTLAHYEITGLLGKGGMGEVYKAQDTKIGREVALKVLPSEMAEDPERLERFQREARAVGALNHPNVVTLFSLDEAEGQHLLVMEHVDGKSLDKIIPPQGLPLERVFEIAVPMADALAAAHDSGITHRDLKPANVMVTDDGTTKVLDFGLAKLAAETSEPAPLDETATLTLDQGEPLTREGTVIGTAPYMSPEQLSGKSVDHRTDIFSFGIVLYEMVVGSRPFQGESGIGLASSILKDTPASVTDVRPDLPRHLGRIISHCLEKDPQRRFQSARDIRNELEGLKSEIDSDVHRTAAGRRDRTVASASVAPEPAGGSSRRGSTRPRRLSRRWILPAVVAGALGAVLAGLVGLNVGGLGAPAPLPTLGKSTRVTTGDGLATHGAISPDGNLVVFAAGQANQMRLYIQPVGGGRTINLSEDSAAFEYQPRWSPDGTRILYLTPSGARVASSLGGTSRLVAGPSDDVGLFSTSARGTHAVNAIAWAPDGQRVFIGRGSAISIVGVDEGSESQLGVLPYEVHSCDWSPSGRWVACTSGNLVSVVPGPTFGNLAPSRIVLIDSGDGTTRPLTDRATLNQSPVWSADGDRLYYVSNAQGPRDVYALDIDRDGEPVGEPRRVTTGLDALTISFSADGERLVYVEYTARANLWSLPISDTTASASTAPALTNEDQIVESVTVSPDGQWLVYDSNLFGNSDIFRIPVEGGTPERLTDHPTDDFAGSLSPDGSAIAFHSWRTGSRDVFVQPLDGQPQQVTRTDSQESYPTWSPDGTALIFYDQVIEDGTTRGQFLVESDGAGGWSSPLPIRADAAPASWLADGTLLYVNLESRAIEVSPADGGASRTVYAPRPDSEDPVPRLILNPSEDERSIYFKGYTADGAGAIWSVPASGGRPRQLVSFDDPDRPSTRHDFAVGAGRFFFTLDDRRSVVWVVELGDG